MKRYDPEKHHRRSIRLQGCDYSQAGSYFVTICTQNQESLLGEVADEEMSLNEAAQMVTNWWDELKRQFTHVQVGVFTVMPNHVHGIISVTPAAVGVDLSFHPDLGREGIHAGMLLPRIMQWFKTMTTNEYIRGAKRDGWQPFDRRLCQPGTITSASSAAKRN